MMRNLLATAAALAFVLAVLAGLLVPFGPALAAPLPGLVVNERWDGGVPLGGIGCGHVDLLTDGSFGYVTINNNWDRPLKWLRGGFFAVHARAGGRAATRMLRLSSRD